MQSSGPRNLPCLDNIKKQGFHYSTISAITVSVSDIKIPPAKKTDCRSGRDRVLTIEKQYKRGLLTDKEKKTMRSKVWEETTGKVTDALMKSLDEFNPIYMMANSGARGSTNQIRQLAGMRGRWRTRTVKSLKFRSARTSARALPFWNTSFPRTARGRALPIRRLERQTPAT